MVGYLGNEGWEQSAGLEGTCVSKAAVRPAASVEKFERLQRDPLFEDLAELIAEVLSYAFDAPAAVEIEQWTISCLPSTNRSAERHRSFTLNIGPMEILSVECRSAGRRVGKRCVSTCRSRGSLDH